MDSKKAGVITGFIGLIFLLFPVCWYLYMVIVPPPSDHEYMPPGAGAIIFMFFLGGNILGLIFAGLTKLLLKRSKVLGTLFISSGLPNFFLWTKMFYFFGLFDLLLYTSPIVTILVGISLIFPLSSAYIYVTNYIAKMKKLLILGAVLNIGWGFLVLANALSYGLVPPPNYPYGLVAFGLSHFIVGPVAILGGILMLTKICKIGGMLAILSGILSVFSIMSFLFVFPPLIGGIFGITAKKREAKPVF